MGGIEFENVSLGYSRQTPVLDGFTLTVDAGEVVALVGASGAGKTTLLKLVNRLLLPGAGEVRVQGRDTREWDPIQLRRSVGYVIQEVGLFPHLTVADNIAVVPRLERWEEPRVGARVGELLELIGLGSDNYGERWPDELSGGQRQRVGVARALAADPPVLLMDEPFGALDPVTRRQLQDEFRRIQSRLRKTVLLVTHDMAEAMALADRIGVLEHGQLIWYGSAQAISESQDPRVRKFLDAVTVGPRASIEGWTRVTSVVGFWLAHQAGAGHAPRRARAARRDLDDDRGGDRRAARCVRGAASPARLPAGRDRQHRTDDSEPGDVRLPAAGAAHRRHRRSRRVGRAGAVRAAADRPIDDRRHHRHRPSRFARPAWRWG